MVPAVDHVFRAGVDLVDGSHPSHAPHSSGGGGGGGASDGGSNCYTLDDIDSALMVHPVHPRSLAATSTVPSDATYLHVQRLADEFRDDCTGSSGCSGSSGDSGLGSHETSLIQEEASASRDASGPPDSGAAVPPDAGADADELQAFVRQDQSRIDRIKKRYSASSDDEAEDYGFLRRPSVRGIKTRFGSTSEIIQQMQQQLAPPPNIKSAANTMVTSIFHQFHSSIHPSIHSFNHLSIHPSIYPSICSSFHP